MMTASDDNDQVISGWILEFLARKGEDGVVNTLLVGKYLPVPDQDWRLKKTLLLRTIQSEIERPSNSVSERLLDYLEHVRELDHAEGVAVSESMKNAYCAVAVETTLKFLHAKVQDRRSYFDAVVRIWQDRFRNLQGGGGGGGLLSEQLSSWKVDIEAALWNTNVGRLLLDKYRKIDAFRMLQVYLKQTWETMGPPFLESAASATLAMNLRTNKTNADSGVPPGCGARAATASHTTLAAAPAAREQEEQVQVQGLGMEPTIPIPPHASRDCEQTSCPVRTTSTTEASPNVNQDSLFADSGAPKDGGAFSTNLERKKKDVLCRHKHVPSGDRRVRRAMPTKGRGVKIRDTEELDNEALCEKSNCVSSAQFDKAKAALWCSSLELKALVKDPLPEAMRIAETVLGHMANKAMSHQTQVENQCIDNANVLAPVRSVVSEALSDNENNSRNLCHEAAKSNDGNPVNVSAEAAQANDCTLVNASGEAAQTSGDKYGSQGCGHQTVVPRPSLMERNSTAHISQWDDSDDAPTRLHLPTPKRMVVSPLKRYEMKKISRRRQNKRWSLLEEDTLRDAVHKYGRGNWKLILTIYADIFEERTEVDLKDKWRNMIR